MRQAIDMPLGLGGISSGVIRGVDESEQRLLRQMIIGCEAEHCEVSRHGSQLWVAIPGLDRVLPSGPVRGSSQLFWDRVRVDVEPGAIRYELVYGSWPQIALHALLAGVALAGLRMESPLDPLFWTVFLLMQALPVFLSWITLLQWRSRMLTRLGTQR